ncbi:MAG TPA: glycosyl hydrolase family 38 [Bacteroidales bacterium]|nr:glycosyl hydrolase family 38 [Bacteroidales bacterium]
MKITFLFPFLFLLVSLPAFSQSVFNDDDLLVNGFSAKISGTDYDYHSCVPGLRASLIVRATGGKDFMEWQTDVPGNTSGKKYAAFVWIAALGSGPGKAAMDLTADDKWKFTFYTDGKAKWEVKNDDGSSLSFNSIFLDQYGDHHGYMILRIPVEKIQSGKPVNIKVTGSKSNLSSWYMTYKMQVKTEVRIRTFSAILKNKGNPLQLVEAGIFYFDRPAESVIYADNKPIDTVDLKFGYNSVNIGIPPSEKPKKVKISIKTGDLSFEKAVMIKPVRKWTVDLIQHAHTDIGYTRSQTEILAEHLRYIDYALDYCDLTDDYPENAKFRWTCEASWAVDEYLKCRPEAQVKRLVKRIKEGRIEVTGMYFNFDEIPDEQILAASIAAVANIKKLGVPVELAMQNDVNGIGWCFSEFFPEMGIKYLNMGTHGHRALISFDKPTLFWWESPSGKRTLTFRAEHYMTGNTVLEIHTGDFDKFKVNLFNYLASLELKDYKYNEIAIQHSGYMTDNSPPSTTASDIIKKWNEVFEWPKITTSLAGTFFSNMEKNYSAEFPVIRGAWPDWWTDGFGASAREVATTRKASASLSANLSGLSMAALSGMKLPEQMDEKIKLALEALLFYTEHTTGYSESVREPFSLPTMEQRALKESYAWEANRRNAGIGEETMGLLQTLFQREKDPVFVVFNTLNWVRSGVTTVYIDHQIVPRGMTAGIFDKEGNRLPVQALNHRSDGTYWSIYISDIPAFGFKKYSIRPVENISDEISDKTTTVLENKWYKMVADLKKGALNSITDKDSGLELIDAKAKYQLGEFILEQLANREQMEGKKLNDFKRLPLDTIWFDSQISGEIWNSIKFYGESVTAEGPRGFTIEYRLYNQEKRIEVACSIIKKSITDPESFYIAFPFDVKDGKHFIEVPGGIIQPDKDQIPGSSNDWYTIQGFSAVRNATSQIVFSCNEMPLIQPGNINTGRYAYTVSSRPTHLFSWPMNNYWTTNFNADQRGGHAWSYFITSSQDVSNDFATQFGWGNKIPFLTRIIPGGGTAQNKDSDSFIKGWPAGTVLVSSVPEDDGASLKMHVRETAGKITVFEPVNSRTGKPFKVIRTDSNGISLEKQTSDLKPFESAFFKLTIQ